MKNIGQRSEKDFAFLFQKFQFNHLDDSIYQTSERPETICPTAHVSPFILRDCLRFYACSS